MTPSGLLEATDSRTVWPESSATKALAGVISRLLRKPISAEADLRSCLFLHGSIAMRGIRMDFELAHNSDEICCTSAISRSKVEIWQWLALFDAVAYIADRI